MSLPSEYELDEEGRTIEDPLTGCPKLSKYGWRVFAEVCHENFLVDILSKDLAENASRSNGSPSSF